MAKTIGDIRSELNEKIGQPVKLVSYESRNRTTKRTGTLMQTYPSVFVVETGADQDDEPAGRVSFNYIDVLTGSVTLDFN